MRIYIVRQVIYVSFSRQNISAVANYLKSMYYVRKRNLTELRLLSIIMYTPSCIEKKF